MDIVVLDKALTSIAFITPFILCGALVVHLALFIHERKSS